MSAAGEVVRVDDPEDPRLAAYLGLTDAELRARTEASNGVFVAEGRLAVEALLRSEHPVASLLVSETRAAGLAALVDAVGATGAPVYVASRPTIAATVGFDLHRGVVAIGRRPAALDPSAVLAALPATATVLVIEGVNDHENLGSLFRSAAALGAAAVLADSTCADPYYRRSVRVSLGHVLTVPFARWERWPGGLDDLRAAGFSLVALTPAGTWAVEDLGASARTAILVGAEGPGLSAGAIAAADVTARIRMRPPVDSLNVAVAAAIALHHLVPPGATLTS